MLLFVVHLKQALPSVVSCNKYYHLGHNKLQISIANLLSCTLMRAHRVFFMTAISKLLMHISSPGQPLIMPQMIPECSRKRKQPRSSETTETTEDARICFRQRRCRRFRETSYYRRSFEGCREKSSQHAIGDYSTIMLMQVCSAENSWHFNLRD